MSTLEIWYMEHDMKLCLASTSVPYFSALNKKLCLGNTVEPPNNSHAGLLAVVESLALYRRLLKL